ncbi:MAG: STAS domain-containing protein [Clostridia bacterium]|nr:STAS domain-containing protein [Clostridia bacterium]
MSVTFQKRRDRVVAALHGDLDHHGAAPMRLEIDRRVCEDKPAVLRLDFHDVPFMDSSGVGLVMGRFRLLQTYGGRLELCGMSAQIARIMRLSGIEKIATVLSEKGDTDETDTKHETGN